MKFFGRKKRDGRMSQNGALKALRARGVPVASIIDVGVQRETKSLVDAFPDVPHLLFEPVRAFYPDIRINYRHIRHEIIEAAVCDVDGEGLLHAAMIDGKEVSHAWLSRDGDAVKTVRLDSAVPQSGMVGPFLLKIDVDGADAPARIIDGASGIMDQVSCVVSEMTADNFLDLAGRIAKHDFALWDIVENCYYDDVFYQCDAIFLRRDVIAANSDLRPFSIKTFDPAKWRMITG